MQSYRFADQCALDRVRVGAPAREAPRNPTKCLRKILRALAQESCLHHIAIKCVFHFFRGRQGLCLLEGSRAGTVIGRSSLSNPKSRLVAYELRRECEPTFVVSDWRRYRGTSMLGSMP
jgi:hypothetical protein